MIRYVLTFLATFALGAVVAFSMRTARHQPHTEVTAHTGAEHAAMVKNAFSPAQTGTDAAGKESRGNSQKGATATTAQAGAAVNTVCAICGMDVDPKIPTAEYQGKKVGFGCAMCPPKFKANPEKYGPSYLRNEVLAK